MNRYLVSASAFWLSACAVLPGPGPTLETSGANTTCINLANTSVQTKFHNLESGVRGIESALFQIGLSQKSYDNPQNKYHLIIEGSSSQPGSTASHIGFFFAAATLFIIPAYRYKSYSMTVSVYEDKQKIRQVTAQDSAHGVISLFAGFVTPDSSIYPSTAEAEIGSRLAKKAISAVICS